MSNKVKETDVVIIGAGPVGLFAVFELGLLDMKCDVIDILDKPGGQCAELYPDKPIYDIPGIPEISGGELTKSLLEQIKPFNPRFHLSTIVSELKQINNDLWEVVTDSDKIVHTKVIVIAAGGGSFQPKKPPIDGIDDYEGKSVFYSIKNIEKFYNKEIAIVGGGDTAIEEATYLAKICNNVTMLVRKDHFRASKAMQNRLSNYDNIKVLFNHEVMEVMGENVVDGLKIKSNLTNDVSELKITGLFIAIGHSPNTDIFKGIVDMDDSGYILTDKTSTKTNIPGVFAAGDVQDKDYRQAVTAAGTGCMAALDAERYLQEI